jgi:hypothetical protein
MNLRLQHHVEVALRGGHVVRRRDFLKGVSLAALASGALGWSDLVSLKADELRKKNRACILLWMQGGPSQFETFSPKPGHENGGPTAAIKTSVPGIEVSGNFPEVAKMMGDLAIIRSMQSKEGAHPRASYLMHTGYLPMASVKFPAFGSVVSHEFGLADFDLPAYVRIGGNFQNAGGGGFLGAEHDPFLMQSANKPPENTRPMTETARFNERLNLLSKLETAGVSGSDPDVEEHQKLYRKVQKMIQSPKMKAFDISDEPEKVRAAYGEGQFASGCLLARRLVETGVPFVEVLCNGWDTHNDNFDQVKKLADQVDQPFAALVRDLKSRGMYDSTLVVWMGEFGRTPKINPRNGRDHYPKAFNVVLGGAGIKGGQVIGKTDATGSDIVERPVLVTDLFQTFCHAMKLDPAKENVSSIGRPIKIVDGGKPVMELFS